MTAFDRQQVIEDAARAMHNTAGQWPWERLSTEEPLWAEGWRDNAKAAVPVIVAAALKPIRDLHTQDHDCANPDHDCYMIEGHCTQVGVCENCRWSSPCPTAQLCDEIEATAKGGE